MEINSGSPSKLLPILRMCAWLKAGN